MLSAAGPFAANAVAAAGKNAAGRRRDHGGGVGHRFAGEPGFCRLGLSAAAAEFFGAYLPWIFPAVGPGLPDGDVALWCHRKALFFQPLTNMEMICYN